MDDLFSCDINSQSLYNSSTPLSSIDTGHSSNEEYLLKIEPDGDDCPAVLYMLVNIRPDVYYIEASDGIHTWIGYYPHSDIITIAKHAKMAEDDVAMETKCALTGSISQSEYTYTAITNHKNGSLEFTWKKQLATDNVKVTLGKVILESCSDNQLNSRIMEYSVSQIVTLKDTIVQLKNEKDRYSKDRSAVLDRLEKCVNIKEEMESDLYGKFKLILNEKKAKVRRLMESLNRASTNHKQTDTSVRLPSADTTGQDTTDEEVSESDCNDVTPSPKSKVGGVLTGNSLLKDDWQTEVTSSPVKKRKRTKNTTG